MTTEGEWREQEAQEALMEIYQDAARRCAAIAEECNAPNVAAAIREEFELTKAEQLRAKKDAEIQELRQELSSVLIEYQRSLI
jgi:hypothetical protein